MSKLGQSVLGGGCINASLDELLHDLCCGQENHHRGLVRVFHLALGVNLLVEVNLLNGRLLAILTSLLRGLRRRRAFLLVGGPRRARGEGIQPSDIFESDNEAAMVVIIVILSVRVLDDARVSHFCRSDQ